MMQLRHGVEGSGRWGKLLLIIGFTALTAALVAAIQTPSRGYELSIYEATPMLFWGGIAVAVLCAMLVGLSRGSSSRLVHGSLLLAGVSGWATVALPLLRGYYYYGAGDALSHLGFARVFQSGQMSPIELIHPGVHLVSIFTAGATGLPLRHTLVLSVFVFFASFLLFVPLCVRELTGSTRASLVVGLLTALLLLPINSVSTHAIAHPTSQTILYTPFMLFLVFLYLRQSSSPGDSLRPTAIGAVLGLTSVAMVLFHPEQALNALLIMLTIVALQFLARLRSSTHPFVRHHRMYFQAGFLALVFLIWAPQHDRFDARFGTALESLLVRRTAPGGEVSSKSGSLAAVGGSLEELFVKLFLAGAILSAIAGLFMLVSLLGRFDEELPDDNALVKYLAVAFVPLFMATGLVFVASFGDHYFRYVGFIMMLVTIVGAAALTVALPDDLPSVARASVRPALVLLFLVLLPLGVMSIHPSPWIYQGSAQVTEQQMVGYETAFENRSPEIPFTGVRSGPRRFVEATYGPESPTAREFPGDRSAIPERVFATNLTTFYDEPRYVTITERDVKQELVLYDGFRYPRSGFQQFDSTPGIDRIQSNGEFRLYLLTNDR